MFKKIIVSTSVLAMIAGCSKSGDGNGGGGTPPPRPSYANIEAEGSVMFPYWANNANASDTSAAQLPASGNAKFKGYFGGGVGSTPLPANWSTLLVAETEVNVDFAAATVKGKFYNFIDDGENEYTGKIVFNGAPIDKTTSPSKPTYAGAISGTLTGPSTIEVTGGAAVGWFRNETSSSTNYKATTGNFQSTTIAGSTDGFYGDFIAVR